MLTSKSSYKQLLDQAVAAVQSGKMTQRAAAKEFNVSRSSLSRKLVSSGWMVQMRHAAKAERDQWFADHQAGMSARKIAVKYGRDRDTINREIHIRQQEQPQADQTSAPTPKPGLSNSTQDQILNDWNGQLADHHKKIIRREKPRNRKTTKFLEDMGLIKQQLKQTMDAASKDTREYGAGFLRMYMVIVEEQLRLDNEPQIKTSLEALRKEARDIWKYADESLRLLQLQDGCSEFK